MKSSKLKAQEKLQGEMAKLQRAIFRVRLCGKTSEALLRSSCTKTRPHRRPLIPGIWWKECRFLGSGWFAFPKKIPRDPTNNRLIDQLVGAGTSVGANYCEANEAVSKKDFSNTVSRCVKEAKETKFSLRMVVASEPDLASEARTLYREAHELLLIFGSMRHKCSAT